VSKALESSPRGSVVTINCRLANRMGPLSVNTSGYGFDKSGYLDSHTDMNKRGGFINMCVLRLCGCTGNRIEKNWRSKVQNQNGSEASGVSENKSLRSPNRNITVNPDILNLDEQKNEAKNGQENEARDLEIGVINHHKNGLDGIINMNYNSNKNVNNRNYDNNHSYDNSINDNVDVISNNGINNNNSKNKNNNNDDNINNDNVNDSKSESSNINYDNHLKQGEVLSANSVNSNALLGNRKKSMINANLRKSISNLLPKVKQYNYFIVEVTDSSAMGANEVNICIYIYVYLYL
jgi:hypothetical protein